MERLTQWFGCSRLGREVGVAAHLQEKYTEEELVDVFAKRLAAYEDTGLEPEELARFNETLRELMRNGDDVPILTLVNLANAQNEGRLVVLPPFNIGDTIYDIWEALRNGTNEIRSMVVTDIYAHVDKRRRVRFVINGNYFEPNDIGKTVFLTREEAENALRGGDDNG